MAWYAAGSVTLFLAAQLVFLGGVIALIVERVRTLAYRSSLDAIAFRRALARLLRTGERERAEALVREARPAWVAETVWPMLDPERSPDDRVIDAEDAMMDVEGRAVRGMRGLRISATIASALGFIGAAIEIHWIFAADHGIARLQAGLVENVALGHAVLSVATGIATSSLALGCWSLLKGVARERVAECRRVAASVEELLGTKDAPEAGVEESDDR